MPNLTHAAARNLVQPLQLPLATDQLAQLKDKEWAHIIALTLKKALTLIAHEKKRQLTFWENGPLPSLAETENLLHKLTVFDDPLSNAQFDLLMFLSAYAYGELHTLKDDNSSKVHSIMTPSLQIYFQRPAESYLACKGMAQNPKSFEATVRDAFIATARQYGLEI